MKREKRYCTCGAAMNVGGSDWLVDEAIRMWNEEHNREAGHEPTTSAEASRRRRIQEEALAAYEDAHQ